MTTTADTAPTLDPTPFSVPSPPGPTKRTKRQRSLRRSPQAFLTDLLLDVLALLGLICIIAIIAAYIFNISLIMFRTGSMSPAIPPGSLAIVKQIPAEEVRVGDVVTIDRPGQLPVTHRVVAKSTQFPGGPTSIEMKGDANEATDPAPYSAHTVRRVLWSAPGLGYVVAKSQRPEIMAGTSIAIALLVGWAFWPRRPSNEKTTPDSQDDPQRTAI